MSLKACRDFKNSIDYMTLYKLKSLNALKAVCFEIAPLSIQICGQ